MHHLVFAILLFSGVTSLLHAQMLVTDEYKSYKHKPGKKLAIMEVLPEQLVLRNEDDVIDDLGKGEPKEVFLSHFRKHFKKGVWQGAVFRDIRFATPVSDSGFSSVTLALSPDDSMIAVLPPPGHTVRFDSVEADFVMFFTRIITTRYQGANGSISYFGRLAQADAGETSMLYHDAFYAVWDNRAGKLMAYGGIRVNMGFFPSMTKGTWRSCTEALGKFIAQYSFLGKK